MTMGIAPKPLPYAVFAQGCHGRVSAIVLQGLAKTKPAFEGCFANEVDQSSTIARLHHMAVACPGTQAQTPRLPRFNEKLDLPRIAGKSF